MIQMTVGDFKAQFSSVLEKVMEGEEVQILYGRAKKPVACLNKIQKTTKPQKRPLGSFEGKATYWEDESFRLTPESLFDDMDDLI